MKNLLTLPPNRISKRGCKQFKFPLLFLFFICLSINAPEQWQRTQDASVASALILP